MFQRYPVGKFLGTAMVDNAMRGKPFLVATILNQTLWLLTKHARP